MDKRYQIFISSTFSDLKDERNKVMQTIMSLDCIPAGMELFPAMDKEQFEFIKRIIDDCDYYLLIIGARYGSMDENGVSYTEKEYDYAVSKNIPVIAFLHNDISSIPLNKADLCDELRQKLDTFRKKVEKGRLVQYWKNEDELNAKVAISLPKTIKMFPRVGWVRANLMTNSESLQEINELRKELDKLRLFKAKYGNETKNAIEIADWDEEFCAHFDMVTDMWGAQETEQETEQDSVVEVCYTWIDWFKIIALIIENKNVVTFNIADSISSEIQRKKNIKDSLRIDSIDFDTIKYQFISYGVIEKNSHSFEEDWNLTKKGERLIAQLMCVKTKKR